MTPEEHARQNIDQQLELCGWIIQDVSDMNIMAGLGVAVREFPLVTGEVDYGLYVDGQVIGVIEAKKEGHSLTGVETQSGKYAKGLPPNVPHYMLPLPFAYESTGILTRFTSRLDPFPRSRDVFTFHRPEELLRMVQITKEDQLRSQLRDMPELQDDKLWPIQRSAITNLETSLADNRPRSLIQMTMGSGKTFTAVSQIYRLIKFAGARRILFLVDRNNLGKQTDNEFQSYISPYNNYKFTEEYGVQRLTKNTISDSANVVITTIQRLYSMLQGEPDFDERNEEQSFYESDESGTLLSQQVSEKPTGHTTSKTPSPLKKQAIPVAYNPNIPIETFDFIVIDECHRSIYNQWRQVLDYFDAFIIGLTATPTKQTLGFFNQNLVEEYDHTAAVADNVNVGFDVYSILTKITRDGAELDKEPEFFVPHRDRRTKATVHKELDDNVKYDAGALDRDVVADHQIRLIIRTFKNRLFTEIFPGRTEVPKTLIFAKTDLHADDIVKIVREEFGKGNDFCQKITSKSHKPDELLQAFRNTFNPRIAVTVDADKNRELAAAKFRVPADDVTDEQLDQVEIEQVKAALRPFHTPELREVLLRPEHQVIDKFNRDQLLDASYDPEAKAKAEGLITSFRQFIEDNKDEIEAISILYSRPYAAGLRYSQIKDLARRLSIKPFHVDESQPQTLLKLWQAFGAVHPDKVDTNGKHCKHIVDLVALVRHAIDPDSPLRPVGMTVEERFTEWLSDQQSSDGEFTDEQMQWLVAIKDHIASSLMIEQDDFEYAPFNQFGGIGRAYELFGEELTRIMEELNTRLAA
ncbi:DEAD/DEAH box helicase family protein [Planctomycetota bacterium]